MASESEKVKPDAETVLIETEAIDSESRPARLMRVVLDGEAIDQYAEILDQLPPIRLIFDESSNTYWVVDGSHRIQAAWNKGVKQIRAVVTSGSFLDAFALAARANDRNGVRITHADIQKRLDAAAEMSWFWGDSLRAVGEACNVSHQSIANKREEFKREGKALSNFDNASNGRVRTRDNRTYPATRPAPPREPVSADAELEAEMKLLMELREALMQPLPKPEPQPEEEEEPEEPAPRIDPARVASLQQKISKSVDVYLSLSVEVFQIGGFEALKEVVPPGHYQAMCKALSMITSRYERIVPKS